MSNADYIGQQFGSYKIIEFINGGTFGSVYRAKHAYFEDDPIVAIKILHSRFGSDEERAQFITEANLLRKLEHSHILPIKDVGVHNDIPYMITEYALFGSLKAQPLPLPLDTIVDYTRNIADGLDYAHQRGIVHRDIKPDNIFLGPNREIWVGDFGIATPSHTRQVTTKTQPVIGTYAYMAPEHWDGRASSASDQYSLGIMVYEWLCGSRPFTGNEIALYQQHKSVPPPSLREKLPTISPAVERVVMKALAKNPLDRFENIMAFAIALERATIGKGVSPVKPSPAPVIPQTLPDPIEQLFQEGVRAHAMRAHSHENAEKAFHIWRQIMMTPGIAEQYRITARNSITELRTQMIPLRLKQARKASLEGHWQDEIRWWKDLLALAPSEQDLAPLVKKSLTLGTYFTNNLHSVRERLRIAQQNFQFVSMYSGVKQHIHNNNIDYARDQLQILWRDAPYYGDPEKLAQSIGLPAAMNYEQALFVEEERKRQALFVEKERERQKQLEQEKERVALLKQEDEIEEQERNKHILMIIIGTIVLLGVGAEGVRVGIWGVITGAVEAALGAGVVIAGAMAVGVLAGVLAVVLAATIDEDEILKGVCAILVIVTGLGGLILVIVTGLEGEIVFGIMEGIACILLAIAVYWATVFIIIVVFGIIYGISYITVFMIVKVLELVKSGIR